MYRMASKRLLINFLRSTQTISTTTTLLNIHYSSIPSSILFSTSTSNPSLSDPNPNPNPRPNLSSFDSTQSETSNFADHLTSQTTSSSSSEEPCSRQPIAGYKEEQDRVLHASLNHVERLGWSEAAMMAGAKEVGISPSIVGSFPRKEAALVEYFMDVCLEKLIDMIETNVELKNLIPSQRISKLMRIRLEMQAPCISKWAQALSIQALPTNIPTSFKQRASLVDEIWHAAGDDASDLDWYMKRTMLGGIYSATEVYMLTDNSPDFRDTWAFLDARVRDAFDLKTALQEARHFAETVGAGLGGSLPGLMKGFFKG